MTDDEGICPTCGRQPDFRPNWAVHPGESLRETLEVLGLTQQEIVRRTGIDKGELSKLIHGKRNIGPRTALRLERALPGGPSAEFWARLQAQYDVGVERQQQQERRSEQ